MQYTILVTQLGCKYLILLQKVVGHQWRWKIGNAAAATYFAWKVGRKRNKNLRSRFQVGVAANEDVHFPLINGRTFEHTSTHYNKIIFNDRRFGQGISADPIFVSKTAKDLAP